MAANIQTYGHAVTVPFALLARLGAKAHAILKTLQLARMVSTLSNMSDHQLDQIGISRADIPTYAKTLVQTD